MVGAQVDLLTKVLVKQVAVTHLIYFLFIAVKEPL